MAQFTIPLDFADANFDLDVELSGTVYTLELKWNTRAAFWTASLKTFQGDYIVAGEAVRADWQLFRRHHGLSTMPPGRLMAVDMSGAGLDPTRDDLGVRVLLVYDDGE